MSAVPARDTWSGPGTVTSDPAGYAISDQHVFYRAADGTLAHRYWDGSSETLAAENWGGSIPL